MNPRVRIGKRGKEQPAKITGVAVVSGHGCVVGVNLTVPNGSLPDVGVFFAANDPNTAALARHLAAALDAAGIDWHSHDRDDGDPVETCGRCGTEFPAGGECSGPGYHP